MVGTASGRSSVEVRTDDQERDVDGPVDRTDDPVGVRHHEQLKSSSGGSDLQIQFLRLHQVQPHHPHRLQSRVSTWSPKILAGIGKLADTLRNRSPTSRIRRVWLREAYRRVGVSAFAKHHQSSSSSSSISRRFLQRKEPDCSAIILFRWQQNSPAAPKNSTAVRSEEF